MDNTEFLDESVTVTAVIQGDGQMTPQSLTWQGQQYTVVSIGRQWDESAGRHILVEVAGGTRFELQLRRQDLVWRVRRVWWASLVA